MIRQLFCRTSIAAALLMGMSTSSWADLLVDSNPGNIIENNVTTTNDSGKVDFSVSGNTLTIVLTNTTSGPVTQDQGNALTGIGFSITGSAPSLSLSTIALTSGSDIWTSTSSHNTSNALSGSWTSQVASSPAPATGIQYGVATTGANGNFNGGSISRGNASPDYGIISGPGSSVSGSKFPFIENSLTFTLSGASGLDLSKLSNFRFFFGTDGGNLTTPQSVAPEPSSLGIAALGALGMLCYARRRRRAPKV